MEFEDKENIIANNYCTNSKYDNWNKIYYEFNKVLSTKKLGLRVSKRVGSSYTNYYIYTIIDEKEWILTKIKHGIL